ncbi:PREDICTED: neurotrophin-4-like [Priapulus caudatus]|uniref:Neurotrophin-4-like n=1 Tax=Priapulus caudatus TaxID=37621 RepID=A0ABM1DSW8_PRICU|nr:PREDICTED: neurotrophin-4-like [Priapulus caudatus]
MSRKFYSFPACAIPPRKHEKDEEQEEREEEEEESVEGVAYGLCRHGNRCTCLRSWVAPPVTLKLGFLVCCLVLVSTASGSPVRAEADMLSLHYPRHSRSNRTHVSAQAQLRRIARLESVINPQYMSSLVVLAPSPPSRPPFSRELNYNELYEKARKVDGEQTHGSKRASKHWDEADALREKRAVYDYAGNMPQSVCNSNSSWGARLTAFDRDDREVAVLQEILINGLIVNQYFYETTCVAEKSCYGVNHRKFYSICRSSPVFVYAYVINAHGDTGWSHVKVSGACDCALYKK